MTPTKLIVGGATAVVLFVLAISILFGSFYTVDQGEEGVLLTNGAVQGAVGPGLHFKTPFVDSVALVTTQSHFEPFKDMQSYSRDQQNAVIQASISYHIPAAQVAAVYGQYGDAAAMVFRLLGQRFPAIFKDVFGQYDASEAVQNRAKLNADVLLAMQDSVKGEPIIIESVQVTDIKYSDAYEQSIEAKQQATVEVQKQQQLLAQEQVKAQIALTQATGIANARVAQANAEATATKLNGDAAAYVQIATAKSTAQSIELTGAAQAAAIRAKGDALQNNPQIVQLTLATQWNGQLPTTMVPNSTVPFLDVAGAAK